MSKGNVVIKAGNRIKSNALRDRLFGQPFEDSDEVFNTLIIAYRSQVVIEGQQAPSFCQLWHFSVASKLIKLSLPLNATYFMFVIIFIFRN